MIKGVSSRFFGLSRDSIVLLFAALLTIFVFSAALVRADVAPTASDGTTTITQGGFGFITITGSGGTFYVTSLPSTGTLLYSTSSGFHQISAEELPAALLGPNLQYVPTGTAQDSFTFVVSDGVSTSSTATQTITITSPNIPAVAVPVLAQVVEDTPTIITLNSIGTAVSYIIKTLTTHGTLTTLNHLPINTTDFTLPGGASSVIYTPNIDSTESDSFTYSVMGNTSESAAVSAALVLQPSPDTVPPPTFVAIPDQTVVFGSTVSATASAVPGVLGGTITYSLTAAPVGATINPTTGLFNWTTAPEDVGKHTITIKALENNGKFTESSFVVDVKLAASIPPIAVLGFAQITANTPKTLTLNATGGITAYNITALPALGTLSDGAHTIVAEDLPYTIASAGNTVVYTPPSNTSFVTDFTFQVTNGTVSSSAQFTLASEFNLNPTLDPIANQVVVAGQTVSVTASSTPAGSGDTVTYSLASTSPAGASIASTTGVFTWTTSVTDVGVHTVTVIATESNGGTASQSFTVTVGTGITVPLFALPGFALVEKNTPKALTLQSTGGSTFIITKIPEWGTVMDGTHTILSAELPYTLVASGDVLTYTPNTDYVGADSLEFKVANGTSTSVPAAYVLSVMDGQLNLNPTLDPIANQVVVAGQTVSVTASSTPAGSGDTVTYSLASTSPAGASIASTTGVFTWTTSVTDVGVHTVTVIATESNGGTASQSFTVTVNAATVVTPTNTNTGGGGGSSGGGGGGSISFVSNQGNGTSDMNSDGKIDVTDFATLMSHWNQTGVNILGDINRDNVVDILDFNILLTNWTI